MIICLYYISKELYVKDVKDVKDTGVGMSSKKECECECKIIKDKMSYTAYVCLSEHKGLEISEND